MAPLKIPLQVSCPNCQSGNLPGSPYCSRCGASLAGISAAAPGPGGTLPTRVADSDPVRQFTSEGQDPSLVQQAHARASEILTTGETLEYVAVANRGSLTHAPDCAVATNKRILLYRKKVLGKLEQEDFAWRDVRNASMKDGRNGVTFTLEAIQGWQMVIESLPKAQAWRLYELAIENSEKLAETLRANAPAYDPALDLPDFAPAPVTAAELPPSYYAPPSAPALPAIQGAPTHLEPPVTPLPEPPQPQPTPESVLQAILQQAANSGGAHTRPMSLSAAAFTAPVADAQPVTFSEANPDANMRSMPRLNNLEQIAVFTGPLSGRLPAVHDSSPLSPYEPRSVEPSNGASSKANNGSGPDAPAPSTAPHEGNGAYDLAYEDGPMPLPGSHSSGPLLAAAYGHAAPAYSDDLISGGLETQQLYAQREAEMADRITSTNLSGMHDDRMQADGRTRRTGSPARPVPGAQKSRPLGGAPSARPSARGETDDPVQKMKQLKAMLDAGLIDSADYEAKKAEILSRL